MTVLSSRFRRPRWRGLAALLLVGGLSRPVAAQTPPVHSISGAVELDSVIASGGNTHQPVTFELTASNGGVFVQTVTLGDNGVFTLPNLPAGTYTLYASGSKWLRSAAQTVDITTADAPNISIFLPGGDANHDNSVDSTDFGILIGAFNTAVGDSGYDPTADFTCDGFVDSSDFAVLIGNYGGAGAIYELTLNAAVSKRAGGADMESPFRRHVQSLPFHLARARRHALPHRGLLPLRSPIAMCRTGPTIIRLWLWARIWECPTRRRSQSAAERPRRFCRNPETPRHGKRWSAASIP